MREIKFRAWNKKLETMADSDNFKGALGSMLIATKYQGAEQFTFMQYTGLKDKHNKEIYEGDLITITNPFTEHEAIGIAEVVFSYDYVGGWVAESKGEHLNIGTRTHMVSVVGNRFENPELLKEEVK